MIGWWLSHPNVVKATVVCVGVFVLLIALAADFDLDPHDEALEPWPQVRPGDFPRHVRIHPGSRPFDWGTDPDTAYLTDPKDQL